MLKFGEKYKLDIDLNNVNDSHVMAINYIEPNSVVLDVGCACGDLGIALKNHKNCLIYGLEYDKDSCEIARKTDAYENVKQFDLNQLSEDSFKDYISKFDYVVCNDILEHLRNPENTIKILKTYLKPNGAIIASIPNNAHASIKSNLLLNDFTYTQYGVLDETHVHLFTYKSIASMFASAGLCIEKSSFTFFEKNGLQPENPYEYLSDDIKRFVLEDWHSYVWQYVVKAKISDENQSMLCTKNISAVNIKENNAPDYIKQYKQQYLSELSDKDKQLQDLLYKIETSNNKIEELKKDIFGLKENNNILSNNLEIQMYKYYKKIKLKNKKYSNIILIFITCLMLLNILFLIIK